MSVSWRRSGRSVAGIPLGCLDDSQIASRACRVISSGNSFANAPKNGNLIALAASFAAAG